LSFWAFLRTLWGNALFILPFFFTGAFSSPLQEPLAVTILIVLATENSCQIGSFYLQCCAARQHQIFCLWFITEIGLSLANLACP